MPKRKPKANLATSVIFIPDKDEYPKVWEVTEDGEAAAIVTRSSSGDRSVVNLHVFVDSRDSVSVLNVPHYNYADKGESCWKQR
jgi:hypothetical protein